MSMDYCNRCGEGVVGTVAAFREKLEESRVKASLATPTMVLSLPQERVAFVPKVAGSMWDLVGGRRAPSMWEAFR